MNPSITLDSCLENYVVHGKCVYNENYVDLNFDGTFRKCPFTKNGIEVKKTDTIQSMIKHKEKPECIYSKLFGGNDV